jgi:LEA14-like dessication related protein
MKKLLIFAYLLSLILWGCKKPQEFEYRGFKNFKIQKFGFDKTNLSMDLVYFNPNNFGVDLKKINCDIFIDNNYLGKFALDTTLHIEKKSEFALPAVINVDMKNFYKNTLNVLFSKEVTIKATGTTKVGKAGFYINFPIAYEAKHKIDLL